MPLCSRFSLQKHVIIAETLPVSVAPVAFNAATKCRYAYITLYWIAYRDHPLLQNIPMDSLLTGLDIFDLQGTAIPVGVGWYVSR